MIRMLAIMVLALLFAVPANAQSAQECEASEKAIVHYRTSTWSYQVELAIDRSPTNFAEKSKSCPYKRWAAIRWRDRAQSLFTRIRTFETDHGAAICFVFGSYCEQAKAVARCESGQAMSKHARNGQYLGMFQMGEDERERYGHSDTALGQARAAYAYFIDSGRDWSPWSCKPWS